MVSIRANSAWARGGFGDAQASFVLLSAGDVEVLLVHLAGDTIRCLEGFCESELLEMGRLDAL